MQRQFCSVCLKSTDDYVTRVYPATAWVGERVFHACRETSCETTLMTDAAVSRVRFSS